MYQDRITELNPRNIRASNYRSILKVYDMALPASSVIENNIINKIYSVRDLKVMLDIDLAELYMVETKQLKRQVRRNIDRFPEDFMFELNKEEFENLRSQIGTSRWGGTRYLPMAFTEQGVAMPARPIVQAGFPAY